jgi:hypothetical protein
VSSDHLAWTSRPLRYHSSEEPYYYILLAHSSSSTLTLKSTISFPTRMSHRQHASRLNPAPSSSSATQSVRRNLFNSNLSRRPTRSSSTTSSAPTLIENPLEPSVPQEASSEILVRNANGDYAVQLPGVPPIGDATSGSAGAMAEEQAAELEMESQFTRHRQKMSLTCNRSTSRNASYENSAV